LPREAPTLVGWEMAASCVPAKELGGDYYDWYPVASGKKLGFVVADVSGKGVPAALYMASLRNWFRFTTATLEEPLDVIRQVNALAFPELGGEAFVTLFYGVLDPATGLLRYVNAGHDPGLLFRNGGAVEQLDSTAYPVGMVDAAEFEKPAEERSVTLAHGDSLFLYTDGVTEAEDEQGSQFGVERIAAAVAGAGPRAALDSLVKALRQYIGGRPPHDDVTLMAFKRLKHV